MRRLRVFVLGAITLLVTGLLYWPTVHFNFVWDDWLSFHEAPWLTQGDLWKHYILRDFNNWAYYFRPLVVGLFTLQVRWFDGLPGPMHAVSVGLHLIDVALVGVLAWRGAVLTDMEGTRRAWLVPLCMALYGLHPALIETVAWIGCQFELVLILLVLLGLIANLGIQRHGLRASAITLIFFLAACAKEAALSFPLLLVLFDWILFSGRAGQPFVASIQAMLRRNGLTYAGIVLAGIGYLLLRSWALGAVTSNFQPIPATRMGHLWEICTVYLHYVEIMVWPVAGMGPIHPYVPQAFLGPLPPSAPWSMAAVLAIVGGGFYLTLRHKAAAGALIVATTAALLPVLHIVPVAFDQSLYHERYAALALAMVYAMLPLMRRPAWLTTGKHGRVVGSVSVIATFFWLAFSIIGIRALLPNWSSDETLWAWALSSHPQDTTARVNLLSSSLRDGQYPAAHQLGDRLLADTTPCDECMLKIAKLAIFQHEPARAAIALERVRQSPFIAKDKHMLHDYYLLTGQMLAQQGKLEDAEDILREASTLAPTDAATTKALDQVLSLRSQAKQSVP